MIKPILIILLIVSAGPLNIVNAQSLFDSTLTRYGSDFQQERIYMQFDKSRYGTGETIWCKAYIMTSTEPSLLSKNFYIDWSDDEGNILSHESLPVIESSASGQFDIPIDFAGKRIHVHAYTKWMLNFEASFLFDQDIRIITKKTLVTSSPNELKFKSGIQFFPEGGDLVDSIPSKVAFKAVNNDGLPVKVSGSVINSKGETVATFNSVHDGMGTFSLQPAATETYIAKWTDESGNSNETALPVTKPFGVTINVKNGESKKSFLIRRSFNAPPDMKLLHIVGTMYQQLVYEANIKLEETLGTGGSIPTAQLPTGILLITVFDDNYTPLAERITFVNNGDAVFKPAVNFSAIDLGRRKKNTLEINVPDSIASNLSIAITDAGVSADSAGNIISHLLLGSELKGYIHRPWYYFSGNNDTIREYLDDVMLTNGWRRFKWNELAQGKLPVITFPQDTSYMQLSGRVYDAKPSQLKEAGDLYIVAQGKDSSSQLFTMPVSDDGSFKEPGFNFFDSLKVYYQFTRGRATKMTGNVRFDNSLLAAPQKIKVDKKGLIYSMNDTLGTARALYFADEQARLQKLLAETTLAGVTVSAKRRTALQMLDDDYASARFKGGISSDFDIIDDPTAAHSPHIFFYLQGRILGLYLNTSSSVPTVTYRGGPLSIYLNDRKTDVQEMISTPMIDVAYVKFFKMSGTIAVYTKKGGEVRSTPVEGMPFKIIMGYSTIKEFYSPDYTTTDQHSDLPDVRSTLYWNPYIFTTQGNHQIKLSFFNNDITKKIRVIIEGVSKNGELAHYEQVFE